MRVVNRGARRFWVSLILVVMSTHARAEAPAPFKADILVSGGPNGESVSGTVYGGGSRFRMELKVGGENQVVIVDRAKNVQYMLMAEEKSYLEIPAGAPGGSPVPRVEMMDAANPCGTAGVTQCKRIGAETMNGQATEKWEFTREGERYTAWISSKLRLPIKTVGADGSTIEYRNVIAGAQPAALFEIPKGYQKMDLGEMKAPEDGEGMVQWAAMAKMAEMQSAGDSGDSASAPPGSVWEEGSGWIMNLTVTAAGSREQRGEIGERRETYSAKYTASLPLNCGTPAVPGTIGPMWTHLPTPGAGSPEALAAPVTFAAESEYKAVSNGRANCPIDSAVSSTTVTGGSSKARGSMAGPSVELMVSAILRISPDLKSYGMVVRTATPHGSEQTSTETTTSGCGQPAKTVKTTSSKERDFTMDQFEFDGIPLPSSRTALTGSKTIPMRFIIGGFDGKIDAQLQWNIAPLGGH